MKWIGQHVWDFISRFRNDVYLEDVAESVQDHVVGIDANGKLYKQDAAPTSLTIGGHAVNDIDIGGEWVNADDHVMSSAAVKDLFDLYPQIARVGGAKSIMYTKDGDIWYNGAAGTALEGGTSINGPVVPAPGAIYQPQLSIFTPLNGVKLKKCRFTIRPTSFRINGTFDVELMFCKFTPLNAHTGAIAQTPIHLDSPVGGTDALFRGAFVEDTQYAFDIVFHSTHASTTIAANDVVTLWGRYVTNSLTNRYVQFIGWADIEYTYI